MRIRRGQAKKRTSSRPRLVTHRERTNGGFTLVELLIVMVVTPLLVGAISLALIAMFELESSASDRLGATSSSQVMAANFYRDVQSATTFTTMSNPLNPAPCGSGTQILGLEWNTSSTTDTIVSYSEAPSGQTSAFDLLDYQLTRNQCTETLNPLSQSLDGTDFLSPNVFNNFALTVTGLSCPLSLSCSQGMWKLGWVTTAGVRDISLSVDLTAANASDVDTNSNCPSGMVKIAFCFTLSASPRDWAPTGSGSGPVPQPVGDIVPAQFNGNTGTIDATCNAKDPNMVINGQLLIDSNGPSTVTGKKQDIYASPLDYYGPGGPPPKLGIGIKATPMPSQVPDPLANIPPPSTQGLPQYSTLASATANVVTVGAITYTYVLPGVYDFNLVDVQGSQLVLETGEFIFNQGVSGPITSGVGGNLIYEGGGQFAPATLKLWPMSSGTYAGISLWLAPSATMSLGTGEQQFDGVVYAPGNNFNWQGNSNIWIGNLDVGSASCTGGGTGQTNIGFTQSIDFTSTSPTQANVGDTYTVTAQDPATPNSGNPISFSLDPVSTDGTCSISNATSTSASATATVSFSGVGGCLIDANQSSSNQTSSPVTGGFAEAPTIQQIIQVGP